MVLSERRASGSPEPKGLQRPGRSDNRSGDPPARFPTSSGTRRLQAAVEALNPIRSPEEWLTAWTAYLMSLVADRDAFESGVKLNGSRT